jgi:hypothetical protein
MPASEQGRFEHALRATTAFLDTLAVPYMLIGGIAVIAHGHVRTTQDIDATVSAKDVTADRILTVAAAHDIESRIQEPVAFAMRNQVLLLVHRPTAVPIDVSLAWLPFEEEALGRRREVPFRDLRLPLCDPEDLVIYKLVAARSVDLEDARQLALRHRDRLDRSRIRRTLAGFDEVLEDERSRGDLWREIELSVYPEG